MPDPYGLETPYANLLFEALAAQTYHAVFDDGRSIECPADQSDKAVLSFAREHLVLDDVNESFAQSYGHADRQAALASKLKWVDLYETAAQCDQAFSQLLQGQSVVDTIIQSWGTLPRTDLAYGSRSTEKPSFLRSIICADLQDDRLVGVYGLEWDVTPDVSTRAALERQNRQLGAIQAVERLAESNVSMEQFLDQSVDLLPQAMLYPELALAAIELDDRVYGKTPAARARCRIAYGLVVTAADGTTRNVGRVHLAYREQRPFDASESAFIRSVAERISAYVSRLQARSERENLLQEVQTSEKLLRSIIDATPDWIFVKDQDHRYVMVNQGYANTLHLEPGDFVGKNDLDLGFPEELVKGDPEQGIAGFWADDRAVMDSGQPRRIPNDIVAVDGKQLTYDTLKTPLVDSEGRVWAVLAFARNVTERVLLLEDLSRRSQQLQTAAQVSRAAGSILDSEELVRRSVELIRREFGYYYVGLFLLDQSAGAQAVSPVATLRAGTGQAGRTMVERGHSLSVGGGSMIGQCIALGRPRIALDVGEEAQRFDNPLLPETRSEMALPLLARGQAIGALTIQSEQESAFDEQDITVLQVISEQLAVALQTAAMFEQAQVRAEHERLVRTVVDRIYRATDRDEIMQVTLQELSQLLGSSQSAIRLGIKAQTVKD